MDFVLVVGLIAAAIWAVAFGLRAPLIAGCLVFLLLTVCFGYEFLHFDLGPLPLTLDRVWIGVLLAMFVVQWRLGRTDPKPLAKVDFVLLGFLALVTVSTLIAGPTAESKMAGSPLWRLIVAYVFPAVLYFVGRQAAQSESRVVMLHGFLAVFGVYLGLTGVAEMTDQWWLVFPRYISDPKLGLHFGRARGPMVQSVSYGLYLGICAVAMLLWTQRFGRAGKLVLWLLVPLPLAAAALTLTRSVWMGTGLALLVWAAVTLRDWVRKLVLMGAIGAAVLVLAAKFDNVTAFEREGTAADTRSSAESRATFVYVSWRMFQDRPLFGFGFGQFPEAKLPYLDDRTTSLNLELIRPLAHHNTYLSVLVELGLVGLVLFLVLLGFWVQHAWRLSRGRHRPEWVKSHGALVLCALATYAVQMLFHDVSFTSVDNAILFLLTGTAVGLSYGDRDAYHTTFWRGADRGRSGRRANEPAAALDCAETQGSI